MRNRNNRRLATERNGVRMNSRTHLVTVHSKRNQSTNLALTSGAHTFPRGVKIYLFRLRTSQCQGLSLRLRGNTCPAIFWICLKLVKNESRRAFFSFTIGNRYRLKRKEFQETFFVRNFSAEFPLENLGVGNGGAIQEKLL